MEAFDLVCVGGGVAAGYWAEALVAELKTTSGTRPTILLVSGDPEGLVPYERPVVSKGLLAPNATEARDYNAGGTAFPFTSAGSGRQPRSGKWYRDNRIKMWYGWVAEAIDGATKTLTVTQRLDGRRVVERPKAKSIRYTTLLVATGCSPLALEGSPRCESCSCMRHPDYVTGKLEGKGSYGLGTSHYLRDIADAVKLVAGLQALPPAERSWNEDVVIAGGGFVAMEVAAAIAIHYPNVKLTVVLADAHMLASFFTPEMAAFYEQRLAAKGVRFLRGFRTDRLWPSSEDGEFTTPEGPCQFDPVPTGFGDCRGVIVHPKHSPAMEIRIPARMVLVAIGAVPNTDWCRSDLTTSPEDKGIEVDVFLRTSAPDVFAAGDAATFALALEGGKRLRYEHVQNARDMGILAAKNMAKVWARRTGGLTDEANAAGKSNLANLEPYTPIPFCYSRLLDLSWRFYGVPEGEVAVMGLDGVDSGSGNGAPLTFGAFWVRNERVVGAFLEGGTAEEQLMLEQIARERPRVFRAAFLKKTSKLHDFLQDPGKLEAEDSDFSQLLMCCRCV